ncbi:hypothetical protein [Paracoccus aminovorans]|uniref:hypothetical protein n=1 Tax=Paracoccus aminovorans TaxID=34004 RepID=UPI000782627F|nr:hypothetical protein [Paracoccus aminovorans]MDQ7776507.1 hypothetical protein [Paracoccus aminovorans]
MLIANIVVLALWAGLFFAVWSLISILLTVAVVGLPALLGVWRLAQGLAMMLVILAAVFWLLALAETGITPPLVTRSRAPMVIMPIMALWPALAAYFISRHRRTRRASAQTHSEGAG